MSITVTLDYPRAKKIGPSLKTISGSIAFDSSYPTGGELANGANGITRHFKSCKQIICEQNSGYLFQYDQSNTKIKVLVPFATQANGGVAGANNTIVVANSQTEIAGAGAVGQYAGTEVSNTANLVALTAVRFVAYGY